MLALPGLDANGDGKIQCTEAANYTDAIDVSHKGITDLTGIQAFVNIGYLDCSGNSLTSLDVSSNPLLMYLNCDSNSLTHLDVSANAALQYLDCSANQIYDLGFVTNRQLLFLDCRHNSLMSLNVQNGNNTNFLGFYADHNPLLNCIQVDNVSFSQANWPNIDASAHYRTYCVPCIVNIPDTNFKARLLTGQAGSVVDLNGDGVIQCAEATAVTGYIDLNSQGIYDLTGIEAFTNITMLNCDGNQLTSLDLSANTALWYLEFRDNPLTSVNISNGHNNLITYYDARWLPYLSCIQVDNAAYFSATWGYMTDSAVSYSAHCDPRLIWIGVHNTQWSDTLNWSTHHVPLATDNVIIPPGTPYSPFVFSPAPCNGIIIYNGAVLTIAAGGALTLNGTLINNSGTAGLVIKSNASGTGSLLHNTSNVDATVESFMPTLNEYHFVSSPITAALSMVFHYAWLYEWMEPTQLWHNIVPVNIPIIPMRGYSLILLNDSGNPSTAPNNPVIYRGSLNNGSIGVHNNLTNTNGVDATLEGYNLMGNPYPSAIDWDAASGWTKTDMDNAIYFFKGNQYASYVNGAGINGGTRYIPAMQGFFVRKDQSSFGTGTLKMDNDVRVLNTTAFYKTTNPNTLRLKVDGNTFSDETVIRFDPLATGGFDRESDAYKMFGYMEVPQLYTELSDGTLTSINTLPDITDSTIVPLLLRTGSNGSYSITASEISSFANNTSIILEDKKERTMQLLNSNPVYTFFSDTTDNVSRFLLRFYYNPQGIPNNNSDGTVVFSFNKTIFVNINEDNSDNAEMILYNIQGQELISRNIKGRQLNVIETNFSKGYYLVKIKSGNNIFVKKVYIN